MARLVEQLTENRIRSITTCGLHADGRGLYLQLRPNGARSWIFRFTLNRRTRDMGLGPLAEVSLVQARAKAAEQRALVAKGIDPIDNARVARAGIVPPPPDRLSFQEAAEQYMQGKLKLFRSAVHRYQWRYSLETFAYPIIGRMAVADITTRDVLAVLRPIWPDRCVTAMRLRGRIERILARATVEGHRIGANPATWRGHLQEALPTRSQVAPIVHYRAMEFSDVPGFMAELYPHSEVAAAALRFLILTVARTGEVIGARWHEVDWTDQTWTIPPERAKTAKEHVVPLSTGALDTLKKIEGLRHIGDGFIFPGIKGGKLSQMSLLGLLQRRMGRNVTCHGFRSAFRDWCGDEAGIPRDLAELSLAHVVGDGTERAYRRRTAVERRREVMQRWCDYCLPPRPANVVDIIQHRAASPTAA